MIEPVNFAFNPETAVNNLFQENNIEQAQEKALKEFLDFAGLLRQNKVAVTIVKDTAVPLTPDAIFPNNWISFHTDNSIVLYPMFAINRRQERKQHVLDALRERFIIDEIIDLSFYEEESLFLEGTGSMVVDRANRIAYAALSPRTHIEVLHEFCELKDYTPISFETIDTNGRPIYHTNVMMCMGESFVVICMEAVRNNHEREKLRKQFELSKKEIIEISFEQLNSFAGNMLQLKNSEGELLVVMSTSAFNSLDRRQIKQLERGNRIIHSPLNTIESCGGGSARCMMAEVFNGLK